jgi:hypothetical protein
MGAELGTPQGKGMFRCIKNNQNFNGLELAYGKIPCKIVLQEIPIRSPFCMHFRVDVYV